MKDNLPEKEMNNALESIADLTLRTAIRKAWESWKNHPTHPDKDNCQHTHFTRINTTLAGIMGYNAGDLENDSQPVVMCTKCCQVFWVDDMARANG